MQSLEGRFPGLRTSVRKKPGMYFGGSGSQAIVQMVKSLTEWLVRDEGGNFPGALSVSVEGYPAASIISLTLNGPLVALLPNRLNVIPDAPHSSVARECSMFDVAAASLKMSVSVSSGGIRRILKVQEDGQLRTGEIPTSPEDSAQIVFHPDPSTYGVLNEAAFYKCAGFLESMAILQPGLTVSLTASAVSFAWTYVHGMKTWLLKEDHSRWPLHPETLSFSATREGMRVEGHLRFIHAGTSTMRSWINGHPSHGGSHYEGLGDVLAQMFPDPDHGCRRVAFITNADTGAWIWLPHCFIGGMKLTLAEPRYAGPTRDILSDPEVRDLVRTAADASLPKQWAEAQRDRP